MVAKKNMFYEPDLLGNPRYEPVIYISRTIHLNDYEESFKKGKLKTRPIDKHSNCLNQDLRGMQVYWFGVYKNPNEHDWYGNVNFRIKLTKVLNYFNSTAYFLDYVEYPTSSSSRILLTKKNLREKLKPLDLHEFGSPLYYIDCCQISHVIQCDRKDGASNFNGHNVEILIHPSQGDDKWFFDNCTISAVSHCNANIKDETGKFKSRSCRTFNSLKQETCPFPLSIKESQEAINRIGKPIRLNSNKNNINKNHDERSRSFDNKKAESITQNKPKSDIKTTGNINPNWLYYDSIDSCRYNRTSKDGPSGKKDDKFNWFIPVISSIAFLALYFFKKRYYSPPPSTIQKSFIEFFLQRIDFQDLILEHSVNLF